MNEDNKNDLFSLGANCARLCTGSRLRSTAALHTGLKRSTADINAVYHLVRRRFGSAGTMPDACRWLLDNRYLAMREAKNAEAALRHCRHLNCSSEGIVLYALCKDMLRALGGCLSEDGIAEYISGFQSVFPLPLAELTLLPAVLRCALCRELADAALSLKASSTPDDLSDDFAALFSSIRLISEFDMRTLLAQSDPCEKYLAADPAGIYPLMDDSSRAIYREKLAFAARRRGLAEHELARKILDECKNAEPGKQHIGHFLFPEPQEKTTAAWYICANILITVFLTVLCAFLSHSAAAAFLLILPFSELTKSLLDYVILLCVPPKRLPRLDMEGGIPDDGKTICVISALLTDEKSGQHFSRLLEEFYLANRSCGKNLTFGILADLKEADTETLDTDNAVIQAAETAIGALNEKYGGGFYLFTRGRALDSGRGKYSGFERKRGAILELADLLLGYGSQLSVHGGKAEALVGTRFILTLDSDTVPSPGSVSELVGAMLHPMNAPVLDTKRGIVTRGHGLIHPRMCTRLISASATDFSRIFSGGGGLEPYGALCGEIGMDLFGRGGFSGKGIIDALALRVCSKAHIPDGRVLSHDALEGAYLRGGYLSDVEFSDSFPDSPIAYFRRAHRWTRGDWQNAAWIFRRDADLPDIERWKLFDSLRRSLVAPAAFAAIFAGFIFPERGLLTAALAAIAALASGLLISLTELASERPDAISAKYHSHVLGGIGASIVRTAFRLWLLPYEAWICISAAICAVWRMTVSGKNLLEWETAAQAGGKKRGFRQYFKSMWLAPAAGLLLIVLSDGILAKAVGLMWLLAPAAAASLALPARKEPAPSDSERSYLIGCAKEIWSYFSQFCTEADNFLPPDNYQEQPPVGIAHRTSPTNIGLALCSAMCAQGLGIISLSDAEGFMSRIIGSMAKLERKHGHFLNWYDTRTLRALEPKYLSTVDCGNLCACLMTLEIWLRREGLGKLADEAAHLTAEMDFSVFYCKKRGLLHIGMDIGKGTLSECLYDLMSSEARLTSFVGIAKGDLPRSHWRRLSRVLRSDGGYRGMASWTGTMFEYLMPELFLPLTPDSLLYETAKFCLRVQKRRKSSGGLWGISESAFYSLDPSLSYRYKAHGCARLALKRGQDSELVISPYSSFLALAVDPGAAYSNLQRLEKHNMRARFGFYEAVDFTPSRCRTPGGEAVRCFMVHHLGMSLLAIANYINRDFVRELFMARPEAAAISELLAERVPIGAPTLQLRERPEKTVYSSAGLQWEKRGGRICYTQPQCALLSNGTYNIMLTESGISRAICSEMLIYRSAFRQLGEGHGAELILRRENREYSLLPDPNEDAAYMWEFSEISGTFSAVFDDFTARCTIAAAGAENGELRIVELCAKEDMENACIKFEFEPVLADASDYVNHPAYWRLGLDAKPDASCIMLHRLARGRQSEAWLCLACDKPAVFRGGRKSAVGFLSYPMASAQAEFSIKAAERFTVKFSLCTAASPEEAYSGAQRILAAGASEYGAMVSACAAATQMSAKEIDVAMSMLPHLHYIRTNVPMPTKHALWRYGLSGDLPIICCREQQDIASVTKQFCLIRSCGVYADLVFLSDEGGEYRRPVYSKVRDTLSAYGLEALMGTHAGVRILPTEVADIIEAAAAFTVGQKYDLPLYSSPPRASKNARRSPEAAVRYEYASDGSFMFYANRSLPARAWCNILTNGRLSYIAADSGMGSMWFENAHELKLTPWRNDPEAVHGPESLEYITPHGRFSLFASDDGIPCRVSFGFGYAVWEKCFTDGAVRCTAFIPPGEDVRIFIIEHFGYPFGTIGWKCELLLSDNDNDQPAAALEYNSGVFCASGSRCPVKGLKFRAACSSTVLGWTCDGFSWMHGEYDSRCSALSYPVFAAEYEADPTTVIACGCIDEKRLTELCAPDTALALLEKTRAHWSDICSRVCVYGCGAADKYMRGWAVYQTLACRLLARGSMYQSGGAFGFRDQLQDAVNLILLDPGLAKQQILSCCRHQYLEGDVMHWWHSIGGSEKGVRTHCSDDLLWLVWALCEYTEKTGDASICAASEYYVNSKPLDPTDPDRYETPLRSEFSESVAQHARRALDCCIARGTGSHGLLLFGSGDWNDGMNGVNGESVWLTWFFSVCARRFSDLASELGLGDAERFRAEASRLGKAADRAWDGQWYLRGYWPDGEPIGSKQSKFCRIDSIAQSWACFCPEASNSRCSTAIDSALRILFDRRLGIVKLFDPPFLTSERCPGYIQSYGPGFRENGGQYTHAALWLASACLKRGRTDDGFAILEALLPYTHDIKQYLAEPFVIPADVYSCPGHEGEAGWTWYTGSSGWYFRVFTEDLIGLKLWHGKLYIRPNLPMQFSEFRVKLRSRHGKTLDIAVSPSEVRVDGEKYDGKGIPYI